MDEDREHPVTPLEDGVQPGDVCPNCKTPYENIGHPMKPGVIMQRTCKCVVTTQAIEGGTLTIVTPPSEPIRCAFTPEVDGWAVNVIESEGVCRTVFSVGVQHFTLADSDSSDHGREHCEFIKAMFLKALATLGVSR